MSGKPSDPLGGVKCFSIAGRMINERLRCEGMTDEERRWRAQFLKDQVLEPNEPVIVPAYYKATTNFFRRLYQTPLGHFQNALEPIVGESWAYSIRHYITKTTLTIMAVYLGVYYFKYVADDFTYARTWNVVFSRPVMYPDDPNYPNFAKKAKHEYMDCGFSSSPLYKKYERAVAKKPPSKSKRVREQKLEEPREQVSREPEVVCEIPRDS